MLSVIQIEVFSWPCFIIFIGMIIFNLLKLTKVVQDDFEINPINIISKGVFWIIFFLILLDIQNFFLCDAI